MILRKIFLIPSIINSLYRKELIVKKIKRKGGCVQKKGLIIDLRGEFVFGKSLIINTRGIDVFSISRIAVCKNAILSFGDYSGMSSTSIFCAEKIEIGNYVNIGAGCLIMDSNFHSTKWSDRADRELDTLNAKTSPVKIDNYVFIGARCIICKGVHIGECSMVAAGSVVVKDIPPHEMWGGNPAKFIRKV